MLHWLLSQRCMCAGTPVDAPADRVVDHRFLRCALDVLLAAAELKDHDEVRWTVARRLFCKEPFLDFGRSDPAARSFLLRAAFDLLEIGSRRSIPVCASHDQTCRNTKLIMVKMYHLTNVGLNDCPYPTACIV